MNATVSFLLCASSLATGLAAQQENQQTIQPKTRSREPVDVSVEGLGEAARRVPLGAASMTVVVGPALPLNCVPSIRDQATSGCLTASSTPTLGMLYPYPGLNNSFVSPAFVGGGENNQATRPWSTVAGGRNNTASGRGIADGYATVGGGANNEARGPCSTVGGGCDNIAIGYSSSGFKGYATVGGGRYNRAAGSSSTVAGGLVNDAQFEYSTVGGGWLNVASGEFSTIAGGGGNATNDSWATIGGGFFNAAGRWATVGGGNRNGASFYGTVPGGSDNNASDFCFAAGRRAKANHKGAFVWADSQDVDKPSSLVDQFNVYASGGVRMFTNSAATTGVLLVPGGSTWTMVSDREAKESIEPVDAKAVLDKVSQLPLSTWNYKGQDDSIRHMGPMAQDFYAAFGLGLGEKTIDTIDPNGVALAAIQGLNELVEENERRLAEKDAEIAELREQVEALSSVPTELAALETELAVLTARLEDQAARR